MNSNVEDTWRCLRPLWSGVPKTDLCHPRQSLLPGPHFVPLIKPPASSESAGPHIVGGGVNGPSLGARRVWEQRGSGSCRPWYLLLAERGGVWLEAVRVRSRRVSWRGTYQLAWRRGWGEEIDEAI